MAVRYTDKNVKPEAKARVKAATDAVRRRQAVEALEKKNKTRAAKLGR